MLWNSARSSWNLSPVHPFHVPCGFSLTLNGNLLGTVVPGATAEFSVDTRTSHTPTGPDYYTADVVFAARDRNTGVLSREFPRTISTDRTEYVEINEEDF
jgi:hypothetical protein